MEVSISYSVVFFWYLAVGYGIRLLTVTFLEKRLIVNKMQ